MGCTASKPEEDDESPQSIEQARKVQSTNPGEEDDKTLETLCVAWMEEFGTIKFPAIIGGRRLWYLDEFKPNGSKEKIQMWKEAVIDFVDTSHDAVYLKLSPKNKVRERVVDLNTQWGRLALPAMNLSKEQRIKGIKLTDEQLQKSYALLSADYGYEEDKAKLSTASIEYHEDEDNKSNGGFDDQDFSIGKEVDVQDVFLAKGRKEIKSKWRKAKIIETSGHTIRVHYIGWDDRWDETIDLNRDGDRIRPGGTMTALFKAKSMRSSSVASRSESAFARSEKSVNPHIASRQDRSRSSGDLSVDSGVTADFAFRSRMKNAGMTIFDVRGDGNCLFRAVAHQMYLDPERHMELRDDCIEHMKKYRERYETFCTSSFEEHLQKMSQPGTWGDDLEIRALEEIFDRPFFIYSADNTKELQPVPLNTSYNDQEKPSDDEIIPVKLSYHGKSHYNSVIDRRSALPLPPRNTTMILDSRRRIFEIEQHKKQANESVAGSLSLINPNIKFDDFDEDDDWDESNDYGS